MTLRTLFIIAAISRDLVLCVLTELQHTKCTCLTRIFSVIIVTRNNLQLYNHFPGAYKATLIYSFCNFNYLLCGQAFQNLHLDAVCGPHTQKGLTSLLFVQLKCLINLAKGSTFSFCMELQKFHNWSCLRTKCFKVNFHQVLSLHLGLEPLLNNLSSFWLQ